MKYSVSILPYSTEQAPDHLQTHLHLLLSDHFCLQVGNSKDLSSSDQETHLGASLDTSVLSSCALIPQMDTILHVLKLQVSYVFHDPMSTSPTQ